MMDSVERMRRDSSYTQIDCGMRGDCVLKSVPFFDYFSAAEFDTDRVGLLVPDARCCAGLDDRKVNC